MTLRIDSKPASVSDLRLSIRAPSGQVSWECRPVRDACKDTEGWYRGPGAYEMELSYRLSLDRVEDLHARQRFAVTADFVRLGVQLWFWPRYGASVERPEHVAASLFVTQSERAKGEDPLVVVTPWRPSPAGPAEDLVRNEGSLPIDIMEAVPMEAHDGGRWTQVKRTCLRCGNAISSEAMARGLRPKRLLLPGEERYVGQRAEFGCLPPLTPGRYRRRIGYFEVEVDGPASRSPLKTPGIETRLIERKEYELVMEFAL